MNACARCEVRDTAICRSLDEREVDELNRFGRQKCLRRGEVLQWEGDESLLIGNVIEGVVKLSASTRQGKDQTLGVAYAGDFIGRPFGARADQTVTALSDARVCVFRRADFDAFARRHPELEHDLLQRTLGELDNARAWMLLLGQMDAGERVASFLVQIARRQSGGAPRQPDGAVVLDLPFGRQDIADLLGLTIETVSRQITALRRAGLIDTPRLRTIVIRDLDALSACADGE